ncbi:MAG: caspase family protein [Elusimicrobiota bacterium]
MRISAMIIIPMLLAGCFPNVPAARDPYANQGLAEAPPAFPKLRLALISSENTRDAVDYGRKTEMLGLAGGSTEKMTQQDVALFKRLFGEVLHADSVAAAQRAGVDLAAIVDTIIPERRKYKMEETIIFLEPGGAEIDRVHAVSELRRPPMNPRKAIAKMADELLRKVEAGILGSGALREFAQRKAGGTPVAKAPNLAPILKPQFSMKQDETAFAVVVGIEQYSRITQADYAERDAKAMTGYLLALGFPRRNIIQLIGPDASYSALKKNIESWLPQNIQKNSRVFFYFSGHGAPDVSTGKAYLVPWDGDPAFLKDTAYPTQRLYEKLSALKAKEVILAMDACFSGTGGRSVLPKGARPLVLKVEKAAIPPELTVMAAATGEQITSTLESRGHGTFTYYLLQGLDGEAKDVKGLITVKSLYQYVKPKVQDEARRQNRDQSPTLHTSSDIVIR